MRRGVDVVVVDRGQGGGWWWVVKDAGKAKSCDRVSRRVGTA
jgi:hypothetical protein